MKEYIKKFETLVSADNYVINDIPFIAAAITSLGIQNVTCDVENKMIKVIGGVLKVCNGPSKLYLNNDVVIEVYDSETLGDIIPRFYRYILKVELSSDVQKIDWSFASCSSLSSITIPDSVIDVVDLSAFEGCTSLPVENGIRYADTFLVEVVDKTKTTYTIKPGTKWIGTNSFKECTNMTNLTIPDSVIDIKPNAFCNQSALIPFPSIHFGGGCTSLTSITIPDSVKSIGDYAFNSCSSMTSVVIGSGITTLGPSLFEGCDSLSSITINGSVTSIGKFTKNLPLPSDENGLVYIGDILVDLKDKTKTTYTIKQGTRIICGAFNGCTNLTNITIPDSVTIIGVNAFSGCTSLTNITIPDSVVTIEGSAFNGCTNLTGVTIGNGVKSVGIQAFYDCKKLVSMSIPQNVTFDIDGYLFEPHFGISNYPSSGGTRDYQMDNGLMYSGEYLLFCDNLTRNSYNIKSGTKVILPYAFRRGLSQSCSVTLPDTLETIGEGAFLFCGGITSVTFGNSVTTIDYNAFSQCNGLSSITLPNSVRVIGKEAFSSCQSLTSVTLNNGLTTIGDYAFSSSNRALTGITIPASVTSIGKHSFINLNSIVVANGNTVYDSRNNCNAIIETSTGKLILGSNTTVIPSGVAEIEDDAFRYCYSLSSVTIPDGVKRIGNFSFDSCTGLTNVVISDSVTWIGNRAFYGCRSLESVTLPSGLTSIGDEAFYYCVSLTSITIPSTVMNIAWGAFGECSGLTSITCFATVPPKLEAEDGGYSFDSVFYDVPKNIPVYVPASSLLAYQSDEYWSNFTNIQAIQC